MQNNSDYLVEFSFLCRNIEKGKASVNSTVCRILDIGSDDYAADISYEVVPISNSTDLINIQFPICVLKDENAAAFLMANKEEGCGAGRWRVPMSGVTEVNKMLDTDIYLIALLQKIDAPWITIS